MSVARAAGEEKSKFSLFKLMLLCTVAGCYVGFGYTLCLIVGGNTPKEWAETAPGLTSLIFGVFGFPFGFTCIVVCGAELYTSICAYTAAAWWEGKITSLTVLRMLVVSWCGNFVGEGSGSVLLPGTRLLGVDWLYHTVRLCVSI